MPRPTATRMGAWVRSTACLASRKSSSGLVRICSGFKVHGHGRDRRGRRAPRNLIAAKCAGLERRKPRRRAVKRHVGRGLALEHLAHKDQLPVFIAIADAIADHALAERSGQLGREIAHLVSVREEDQIGLGLRDGLLQRERKSVWRIAVEQVVLDEQNFLELDMRQVRRPARARPCQSRRPERRLLVCAAICCAAANVSKLTGFHLPSRCSVMTGECSFRR